MDDPNSKKAVRRRLKRAVRTGVVIKPGECSECGDGAREHDDYSKPLVVRWLCELCHMRLHHSLGDFGTGHRAEIRPAASPMTPSESWTRPIVARALKSLVIDAVVPRSPYIAQEVIAHAVERAYELGRLRGVMELRTSTDLAEEFGVNRATIFRWARERRAGWRIGRDLLFRPEDVERLRRRV